MRTTHALSIAMLGIMAATSGCRVTTTPQAGTPITSGGAAPTGVAAALAAYRAAKGLEVSACTDNGPFFGVLDPDDGQFVAQLSPTLFMDALSRSSKDTARPADTAGNVPGQTAAMCDGEPLSPDRRRLAVSGAGGIQGHVGWLDLESGKLTDVSAPAVGTGFSDARINDQTPTFAADGSLWFIRNQKTYMVAAPDGTTHPGSFSNSCASTNTTPPGTFTVLDSTAGGFATTCQIIQPARNFAAKPGDSTLSPGFDLIPLPQPASNSDASKPPKPTHVDLPSKDDHLWCEQVLWISNVRLLCGGTDSWKGPDEQFRTVDIDPARIAPGVALAPVAVSPELFPPHPQYTVWPLAITHDGTGLLAIAKPVPNGPTAQPSMLYRADLNHPGAPPHEIGPLLTPDIGPLPAQMGAYHVLGWR